jgi:hypothetical protein
MATLDALAVPRLPAFKGEIPVYNAAGSQLSANEVLGIDPTNTLAAQQSATPGQVGFAVVLCAVGGFPVGVSVSDIPADSQGTMQVDGFIACIQGAGTNCTVGGVVIPDTTTIGAVCKSGGAGVPALGVAWSAGSTAGDVVLVQLCLSASDYT